MRMLVGAYCDTPLPGAASSAPTEFHVVRGFTENSEDAEEKEEEEEEEEEER
jgi:hypothetical protein